MKLHMDGMHCIINGTSILVKIKSVALYNCQTVYIIKIPFKTDTIFSRFRNTVPIDMHSIFLTVSNQRIFAYHYFPL